jgi:putative transposase
MSEPHLRAILKLWADHYNRGRPHMSLGPGLPGPPRDVANPLRQDSRHRIDVPLRANVKPVLGGLHHEYALQAAGP